MGNFDEMEINMENINQMIKNSILLEKDEEKNSLENEEISAKINVIEKGEHIFNNAKELEVENIKSTISHENNKGNKIQEEKPRKESYITKEKEDNLEIVEKLNVKKINQNLRNPYYVQIIRCQDKESVNDVEEVKVKEVAMEEVAVKQVEIKEIAVKEFNEVSMEEAAVKEVTEVAVEGVAVKEVNEVAVEEVEVEQVEVEEMEVEQVTVGEVEEMGVGEVEVEEMAVGEVEVEEMGIREVEEMVEEVGLKAMAVKKVNIEKINESTKKSLLEKINLMSKLQDETKESNITQEKEDNFDEMENLKIEKS